jgi:nitroreductase
MDYFETVRRRQSIRRFSDRPVPHADVLTILEAATQAPSATNDQPWHFIVVRDPSLKDSMRDAVTALLEAAIATCDDKTRRERLAAMMPHSTHFASAPVAIAVLARPWTGGRADVHPDQTSRDLGLQSAAMAVAQLLLAATAMGYAACFASAPAELARAELEALLGVENPWSLAGVISLGVAAVKPGRRPSRKPLDQVCTFVD